MSNQLISNQRGKFRRSMLAATVSIAAASLAAGTARAADPVLDNKLDLLLHSSETTTYSRVATIQVPDKPLTSFDFTAVDPVLPFYYLTDRSNAGLDIIDIRTNTFVTRIGGFVGSRNDPVTGLANPDISGPAAVQPVGVGTLWVSDGDSTVKVVDLFSQTIVDTISTALPDQTADQAKRADGMSYDPRDHILMVQNGAASPPFVTLISTLPSDRRVLGHIVFDDAASVEASLYDRANGLFYVNLPQTGSDPNNGAVSVIDPRKLAEVNRFPLTGCSGAGLALAPGQKLLVGCSLGNNSQIISARDGTVLAEIPQVSGSDQITYNPGDGNFYLAARTNPAENGGPSLGIINAATNAFVANVPTNASAHAVSADRRTNHIFVPSNPIAGDPACASGCVGVYAGQEQESQTESDLEQLVGDFVAQ